LCLIKDEINPESQLGEKEMHFWTIGDIESDVFSSADTNYKYVYMFSHMQCMNHEFARAHASCSATLAPLADNKWSIK